MAHFVWLVTTFVSPLISLEMQFKLCECKSNTRCTAWFFPDPYPSDNKTSRWATGRHEEWGQKHCHKLHPCMAGLIRWMPNLEIEFDMSGSGDVGALNSAFRLACVLTQQLHTTSIRTFRISQGVCTLLPMFADASQCPSWLPSYKLMWGTWSLDPKKWSAGRPHRIAASRYQHWNLYTSTDLESTSLDMQDNQATACTRFLQLQQANCNGVWRSLINNCAVVNSFLSFWFHFAER